MTDDGYLPRTEVHGGELTPGRAAALAGTGSTIDLAAMGFDGGAIAAEVPGDSGCNLVSALPAPASGRHLILDLAASDARRLLRSPRFWVRAAALIDVTANIAARVPTGKDRGQVTRDPGLSAERAGSARPPGTGAARDNATPAIDRHPRRRLGWYKTGVLPHAMRERHASQARGGVSDAKGDAS